MHAPHFILMQPKRHSSELRAGLPACLPRVEVRGDFCSVSSKDANTAYPWGWHHREKARRYCQVHLLSMWPVCNSALSDWQTAQVNLLCWVVEPAFQCCSTSVHVGCWCWQGCGAGCYALPPMHLYSSASLCVQPLTSSAPQSIRYVYSSSWPWDDFNQEMKICRKNRVSTAREIKEKIRVEMNL